MFKRFTIHTSRTIMSVELTEVMDLPKGDLDYFEIIEDNVIKKKFDSSKKNTITYLTQLYGFNKKDESS